MSEEEPKVRIPLPIKEPVGLGDVVHRITDKLGIEHCAPCAKRKARMNRFMQFGRGPDPRAQEKG